MEIIAKINIQLIYGFSLFKKNTPLNFYGFKRFFRFEVKDTDLILLYKLKNVLKLIRVIITSEHNIISTNKVI